MSAQVAADLRAAAEVLRRIGWTQNRMFSPGGRCCAVGAIWKATGGGLADLNARLAVLDVIPGSSISDYNDAPGRTADEVIAALLAAADAAEATP